MSKIKYPRTATLPNVWVAQRPVPRVITAKNNPLVEQWMKDKWSREENN